MLRPIFKGFYESRPKSASTLISSAKNKIMRHFSIILIIFILLNSCSRQASTEPTALEKERALWTKNESDIFYQSTQQQVNRLKIDTLQNGYNSLQIRIWYDYSIYPLRQLFIIKRTDNNWTAIFYSMTVKEDTIYSSEKWEIDKVKNLDPKNGWDNFIKKLSALQIVTLPNMHSIPELNNSWDDGVEYSVEIAIKNKYRFYSYHFPDKFQDKYWQAKNMVDILKLIESEFGVTWK